MTPLVNGFLLLIQVFPRCKRLKYFLKVLVSGCKSVKINNVGLLFFCSTILIYHWEKAPQNLPEIELGPRLKGFPPTVFTSIKKTCVRRQGGPGLVFGMNNYKPNMSIRMGWHLACNSLGHSELCLPPYFWISAASLHTQFPSVIEMGYSCSECVFGGKWFLLFQEWYC